MQRLSGLDAMFFYLETPSSHMHVTGVYVLEPGTPGGAESDEARLSTFETIREMVEERLALAAPFRRRLVEVPFKLSHPMWIEDPEFDLDYHVRRAALPAPGGAAELEGFVGQVVGLPLDRTKPLWEMYIVEGLEGGRIAIVTKMHHAAIDGVSGAEIAATWLDLEADPPPRMIADPWRPDPIPTEAELIAFAMATLVGHPLRAAKTVRRVVESALSVTEHNRSSALAPPPTPFTAPKTPFNGSITPHRRVTFTERPLDDFRAVKNHFGSTVNDVVLAVCAGALRQYLEAEGELPEDPLVAMVPMSVRTEADHGAHGNRVSAMLTSLATDIDDPVERLAAISKGMMAAKEQEELIGADTLTDWTEFAFPAVIGRASRLISSMRVFDRLRPVFNLTISNVPGPPFPLFLAGARMVGFYPLGPVMDGAGLNITVMSYCGIVYFGLNACRETVPNLESLPEHLNAALDELMVAAGVVRAVRSAADGDGQADAANGPSAEVTAAAPLAGERLSEAG